jgi:hypothetical protein
MVRETAKSSVAIEKPADGMGSVVLNISGGCKSFDSEEVLVGSNL